MSESWVCKNMVTGLLRDSDVQKIKAFSFGGTGFDPQTFPVLAGFIDRGKIKVDDSGEDGMAEYDYNTNTIILGFYMIGYSTSRPALILHECTHAVYDVANNKMSVAISESIAYIVQCQYAQVLQGNSNKRLSSANKQKDLVFELAWKIATKIQAGTKPDHNEQSNLQAAIASHPYYMKNATADAGFNGV